MADIQTVVLAGGYEAFILIEDVPRGDSDELGRGTLRVIGALNTMEEAQEAADTGMQATPAAIGCGVRRAHKEQQEPNAKPSCRFAIYQAPSDYMAPTINSGDYVEIDTSVRALAPYKHLANFSDGLFLLDFPGGEPMIRRLASRFNGRYYVYCDRDVGRLTEADEVAEADLKILGRVTRVMNIQNV